MNDWNILYASTATATTFFFDVVVSYSQFIKSKLQLFIITYTQPQPSPLQFMDCHVLSRKVKLLNLV